MKAGDDFSPWLIEQATGQPFDQSAPSLVSNAAMLSMTATLTIILVIVAIFGSLAQVVFMILRGGLLLMLVAVWPLAASMSTTEQGMQWYKKINAYIIAFVLLKLVFAIIYSTGFLLLKGSPGTTGDATTNAITSTLSGLAILGLAGLATPCRSPTASAALSWRTDADILRCSPRGPRLDASRCTEAIWLPMVGDDNSSGCTVREWSWRRSRGRQGGRSALTGAGNGTGALGSYCLLGRPRR